MKWLKLKKFLKGKKKDKDAGLIPRLMEWSNQILFWICLISVIEIILAISGKINCLIFWRWTFSITAVLAMIAGIDKYLGAEKKEEEIVDLLDKHEKKKREIRRVKDTSGYDKLRRDVLRKKLNVSKIIRNNRGKENYERDIQDAEKKLEEAEGKLLLIEVGDGLDIKGELKEIKDAITVLKKKKKDIEKEMILEHYMPFGVAIFLVSVLFIFSIPTFLSFGGKSGDISLWFFRVIFGGIIVSLGSYIWSSRTEVTTTNRGLKFFRNKFYAEVTRGPRIALRGLVHIVKISTEAQRYDMRPIQTKIADRKNSSEGKHSQVVFVDVYYLYHIEKPLDAITELGKDMPSIILKLEGSQKFQENEDGIKKYDEGIIGALISSYVRQFIAEEIETLDEGYQVRDDLSSELKKILMDQAEYLGIRIDNVFVTDVRGTKKIEEARNDREEAVIKADEKVSVAERTATERKTLAKADAAVNLKLGTADAEIILLKGIAEAEVNLNLGEAEAKVILVQLTAKINALTSIDPTAKEQAVKAVPFVLPMLLGDEVLPKVFEALGGSNFNIFAFEGLSKAIRGVFGENDEASELIKRLTAFLPKVTVATGGE